MELTAAPIREAFKGVNYHYANAYELNRAIEELLKEYTGDTSFTSDEKRFLQYYSGYGGLEKYGATGPGLLYEYFTPAPIARRMWGLAYKYGYSGGAVLEPACGTGEFFNYAPDIARRDGYEINPYSARICRILHPGVTIKENPFEELFIKNRDTVRAKVVAQYDLVIGNPPYGNFEGKFAGMGERSYTRASNYSEYFIFRGLDLLLPGGLLIYIIGAEVQAGGIAFLQQQANPIKKEIAQKAMLLDAYRLPNGIFERTDVLSEIIVLQKI
jgi:type I restriction-modification system DNA methylase subunit